jgi:16S rRNA (guanine1207-N2)-methyltransferase
MTAGPLDLDTLRRWPDVEAPDLRAWDAADTLILDEAAAHLDANELTVIGDAYGALTLGALDRGATAVRVHQDALTGELALRANGGGAYASLPLNRELLAGATLVLLRLPRSLDALDQIAAFITSHADPSVRVIAGGRIKHMSLGMNEVLARHFERVDVSLARQKSRLLIATGPRPGVVHAPQRAFHADLGLWVVATGGAFAGTSVDIGTRALLGVMGDLPPFDSAVDLGCGTGILAAQLKRLRPHSRVLASDQSAAAVESTRLTMEANGLDVAVERDDALSQVAGGSADLVLLNPPFHTGAAVHSGLATKLFEASARVLRPGGELWSVWNSHLAYKPALRSIVGETREVARTAKFTVTASTKKG